MLLTVNTPRSRSRIEPTECVSGTLPEGLAGAQPEVGSRICQEPRTSKRHPEVIAAKLTAVRQGKILLTLTSSGGRVSVASSVFGRKIVPWPTKPQSPCAEM